MEKIEILGCKGCWGDFTVMDLCLGGYCEVCNYERAQKLDHITDKDMNNE